jgi:hypothetical protein
MRDSVEKGHLFQLGIPIVQVAFSYIIAFIGRVILSYYTSYYHQLKYSFIKYSLQRRSCIIIPWFFFIIFPGSAPYQDGTSFAGMTTKEVRIASFHCNDTGWGKGGDIARKVGEPGPE